MRLEASVRTLRSRSSWPITAICAGTLCITLQAGIATAKHACDLVTVSELETVFGSPVAMKGERS